jgi:hypothetical protein
MCCREEERRGSNVLHTRRSRSRGLVASKTPHPLEFSNLLESSGIMEQAPPNQH